MFFRIGIVFLIGKSDELEEQEFIKRENKVFGDILQSNAPDLYKYLPEKVIKLSLKFYLKYIKCLYFILNTYKKTCLVFKVKCLIPV